MMELYFKVWESCILASAEAASSPAVLFIVSLLDISRSLRKD